MNVVRLAFALFAVGVASSPQSIPSDVAITYIEGTVYVDGRPAPQAGSALHENAIVRTGKGRAEIVFGRGDTMYLDENSSGRVNHDSTGVEGVEILTGSAVVITGALGPSVTCVQDARLSDGGIFRFDVHRVASEDFCRLRVYKGAAATQMPSFIWVLTSGKSIDLNHSCGDHTPRERFNVEDADALDRWSRQRAVVQVRP